MRRIFICYRREEAEYIAGALGRDLRSRYGPGQVFRDKEDIAGGASWKRTVLDAIDRDAALLVLIGEGWADLRNESGTRRLDVADDPLRMELADALRDGAKVIPVLLGDAKMPSEAQLPAEVRYMAELNALRLRDGDWEHDLASLHAVLDASGFRPLGDRSQKLASPSFITMSIFMGFAVLGLVVEDPGWDDDTYLGFLGISVSALIASVVAFLDHKRRKVRPLWISKIAVGLCTVAVFACVGMRAEAAERRAVRNEPSSGTANADVLTGGWVDTNDIQFSLVQHGATVTGQYVTGGSLVELSGLLEGSRLTLDARFVNGVVARITLSLSSDGRLLQGVFVGPFGENEPLHLTRL